MCASLLATDAGTGGDALRGPAAAGDARIGDVAMLCGAVGLGWPGRRAMGEWRVVGMGGLGSAGGWKMGALVMPLGLTFGLLAETE